MWQSTVHVIVHKIRASGIEVIVEVTNTVKMSFKPRQRERQRVRDVKGTTVSHDGVRNFFFKRGQIKYNKILKVISLIYIF